jgi:hypothetical protein
LNFNLLRAVNGVVEPQAIPSATEWTRSGYIMCYCSAAQHQKQLLHRGQEMNCVGTYMAPFAPLFHWPWPQRWSHTQSPSYTSPLLPRHTPRPWRCHVSATTLPSYTPDPFPYTMRALPPAHTLPSHCPYTTLPSLNDSWPLPCLSPSDQCPSQLINGESAAYLLNHENQNNIAVLWSNR